VLAGQLLAALAKVAAGVGAHSSHATADRVPRG
jgi:hypothetical protein